METGYSDSPSSLSEAPDIRNWFSSYVYESFPFTSLAEECETRVDGFGVGETDKDNIGVAVSESKSPEKVFSNKDDKHMERQVSDRKLYESLPSEPPDIGHWFSSYVYESPVLDTSDGLPLSVLGESGCMKETETKNKRNILCPGLFQQRLASSAEATDFSQSESVLSEPPDVRNWFSSYEYQSPQLSEDSPEFTTSENDQLIIDESDTEDENSTFIFRKTKSKQETIAPGCSTLKDYNDIITADMAKEISSHNAYADQQRSLVDEQQSGSTKEVKQQSSVRQESLFCKPKEEPRFIPIISPYNPKPQLPLKNEASLHEVRPKQFKETISMNSSRQKSPIITSQKSCTEEKLESADQDSDDKENAPGRRAETGFVTTKRARFRESKDQCSMKNPMRGVLVECPSSKELKKIAKDEQEEETERGKKRRVLGEMSNHQFPGAEEISGKWLCPQKNKGKLGPPLKQLRLDAWIHKI